jgi:tetratricopeptide (TPR) repeat protein
VLLYETYIGYGKSMAGAGDIEAALGALEGAEDLAWADRANLMKLFQVQLLIGDINWGAGNFEAAFAAYQDAMENIDGMTRLDPYPETQRGYVEALSFAEAGLYDNAYENFQEVRDNINVIYTFSEVAIENGSTLAFAASNNGSTIHAVNHANDLPDDVVVNFSGTLQVPSIEN